MGLDSGEVGCRACLVSCSYLSISVYIRDLVARSLPRSACFMFELSCDFSRRLRFRRLAYPCRASITLHSLCRVLALPLSVFLLIRYILQMLNIRYEIAGHPPFYQ